MHEKLLSTTLVSNLFTMGAASRKDERQKIPAVPGTIPSRTVRELRAKLIMEEALETCQALGVDVCFDANALELVPIRNCGDLVFVSEDPYKTERGVDLLEVIDGCCDTIYVCCGTLAAFGIPDLPHLDEVNRANNAKFPGGQATFNASGKYLKPPGWTPPDHAAIMKGYANKLDLAAISASILEAAAIKERAKRGDFE